MGLGGFDKVRRELRGPGVWGLAEALGGLDKKKEGLGPQGQGFQVCKGGFISGRGRGFGVKGLRFDSRWFFRLK